MKTANFPAKKEARRNGALQRLLRGPKDERISQEILALEEKPFGNPRAFHSKKDRTARAKVR